jgi:hypothetical protein
MISRPYPVRLECVGISQRKNLFGTRILYVLKHETEHTVANIGSKHFANLRETHKRRRIIVFERVVDVISIYCKPVLQVLRNRQLLL